MGADHSSQSHSHPTDQKLLFERGDDCLAVEVYSATHEDDHVTCFGYTSDAKHKKIVHGCLQHHKVLRHPSILKFLSSYHSGSDTYIVTEAGTPLSLCLEHVTSWEIIVGLGRILEVLHFLHTQAGMSHNNISSETIFITPEGDWKLGRLDCAARLTECSEEHFTSCNALVDPQIYFPSDKKAVTSHIRDINGFGKLCEALLEKLEGFDDGLLNQFSDAVDLMLSDSSEQIPTAAQILGQPLLNSDLVLTLRFLDEITLKSKAEKEKFFRTLTEKIRKLPEVVVAKKLVRPLFKRFIVEEDTASHHVLPHLLTPSTEEYPEGFLSAHLYKKYMSTMIYRLFTVKEYKIRRLLLTHFHTYCSLLDKKMLEKHVMPHILQGLHDTHDDIVALSLVALSHLVPILTGQVVIGTDRRDTFVETRVKKNIDPSEAAGSKDSELAITGPSAVNGITNTISPTTARRERPPRKQQERKERSKERSAGVTALKLSAKRTNDVIPTGESVETTGLDRLPGLSESTDPKVTSANDGVSVKADASMSEEDQWSDWEGLETPSTNEKEVIRSTSPDTSAIHTKETSPVLTPEGQQPQPKAPLTQKSSNTSLSLKNKAKIVKKPNKVDDDFSLLDIKSSVKIPASQEVDFFADMAPKIDKKKPTSSQSSPPNAIDGSQTSNSSSKKPAAINLAFAMTPQEDLDSSGWGGEEEGWDW